MSDALDVKWITDSIRVEIHPDDSPDNPLLDYAIGKHAYVHGRYNLGNCQHLRTAEEVAAYMEEQAEDGGGIISWPVYMYDHSALAFQLGSQFECPWDSGQIGYAFMTKAEIRKQWMRKRVTDALIHGVVRQCLEGELDAYERYINGWYVGFQVMKADEVLESVWGFDDRDYAMTEGVAAAHAWIADVSGKQP